MYFDKSWCQLFAECSILNVLDCSLEVLFNLFFVLFPINWKFIFVGLIRHRLNILARLLHDVVFLVLKHIGKFILSGCPTINAANFGHLVKVVTGGFLCSGLCFKYLWRDFDFVNILFPITFSHWL